MSVIELTVVNDDQADYVAIDQVFSGILEINRDPCSVDRLYLSEPPVGLGRMTHMRPRNNIEKHCAHFQSSNANLQ